MDEADYVTNAKERIREILATEHAVVHLELESRISEAGYAGSGLNIDPHHITTALQELTRHNEIIWTAPEASRGSHPVQTIQPANQHRRTTAITKAAGRKRLLYGRYLGWAQGDKRHPHGLIGPAGEHAVRSGLLESGGMVPAERAAAEVKQLLNVTLPGSLDSGGYVVPLTNGLPDSTITVLVEVKNIRGWMYPSSAEIYQLLDKARALQHMHPDQPILPVFVCRKAHKTSYWMAQQLGFIILDMPEQFAGTVDEQALDEIRVELHFQDLRVGIGPSQRVRDRFRHTIPRVGLQYAAAWQKTIANPDLADSIHRLRYAPDAERTSLMTAFRDSVISAGHPGF